MDLRFGSVMQDVQPHRRPLELPHHPPPRRPRCDETDIGLRVYATLFPPALSVAALLGTLAAILRTPRRVRPFVGVVCCPLLFAACYRAYTLAPMLKCWNHNSIARQTDGSYDCADRCIWSWPSAAATSPGAGRERPGIAAGHVRLVAAGRPTDVPNHLRTNRIQDGPRHSNARTNVDQATECHGAARPKCFDLLRKPSAGSARPRRKSFGRWVSAAAVR
ncbi:hypothetical protein [Actinacidiphila sp. bgisy160]|uniref:hypothetical protein n=1 Tax=Actinacidiphila sp. bgisy160 TaxID=3413796 RepID=UPI003D721DB2